MKALLIAIGVGGIGCGALWALQGLRLLPPLLPTLTHSPTVTLGNGALLIAFSVALIVWANRTRRRKT
ncbi:MAG TPA: hypothetical protein VKT30_14995 [Caulobacteraceae bacterium]|nr:hypothetical protein [Caulobacteraceae bacterium]